MSTDGPPAGWYPHPDMADTQRYWDGEKWSGAVAPMAPAADGGASASPQRISDGFILAAWGLAVVLPCVGFVLGAVAAFKGAVGHGVGAMCLSVVATFGWIVVINILSMT